MGYISTDTELDAILTLRGRELLTNNPGAFNITKFSLSDDEIDYRLWNTSHSEGTDYYGELIENTPVIEPLPGEEQQAKFRLITLPKGTVNLPKLSLGASSVRLKPNQEYIITPQSSPNIYNITQGYTITIWNWDIRMVVVATEDYIPGQNEGDVTGWITGDISIGGFQSNTGESTINAIGMTFKIIAKDYPDANDHVFTVSVTGNETGERATLQLIVEGSLKT